MADNNILPKAQSPVTDAAGRPTRAFYDFFRALVNRVQGQIDGLSQAVATLAKIVASLGGDPDNLPDISAELDAKADKSTTVAGRYSIGGGGTLDSDVYVWLKGDIETPPVMSFYGVLDATAGRGWNLISNNFAAVDNGDDTYTFDLADLTDSGAGAALLKITRDAKGRISGTSAATTTDLTEGTNLYYTDARADARITAAKPDPDGIASLQDGKLDPGQLPALAITETFVVNTEAAMLALDCEQGDVAVRTDLNKSFILTAAPPSTLVNWQELLTPTGAVTSFNGRTGSVVPASGDYTKAQVGLGNVDNTSDADKPVSTAQAAALAPKSAPVFAGSASVDGAAGSYRVINWTTGGLMRWAAFASNQAETGSDAGSNWFLNSYHDDGSFWMNVLAVNRATGAATFGGPISAPNIADSGWQTLTPQNSWGNLAGYATLACRKVGSLVTVRGVLSGGTITDGTLICTLPAGYRPPATLVIGAASNSTDPTARFGIATNGQITIQKITSASFLSMSMSFYVD